MLSMIHRTGCRAALAFFSALLVPSLAQGQINLTAGDVALVGWIDNGSPSDSFAFVTLSDLPGGSKLYFTDSGWTGSAFRNTIGPTNGTGNESLMLFTALAPIPAGTIVASNASSPTFTWTTSGAIPGATSGSFSVVSLTQTGDQIHAFQHATGSNPLNTVVQEHLFVLDDTGTFEPATTTGTGDVPPGLSIAAHTAVLFAQTGASQNVMVFDKSALASGTKAEWLAAIANSAHWTFGSTGTLPSGTIAVTTCVGPSISGAPVSAVTCAGQTVSFDVSAQGSAPLAYQWRRNGVELVDDGHVQGAHTSALDIVSVAAADAGDYDVVVSNACGSSVSASASLSVDPTDTDGDGTSDCSDGCPQDAGKISPGVCGCGVVDVDSDGDGTPDCTDGCPADPAKTMPGACGCGSSETDSDGDGTPDCADGCPGDPTKTTPGACGCGSPNVDSDRDGTPDCLDGCPLDPSKTEPGVCGCGVADGDADGDGSADCIDNCAALANAAQADLDSDGIGDACDNCVQIGNPGQEDCDGDAVADACAIAAGANDCNHNGVPDACDLASSRSTDVNANGIPDECEIQGGTPFCFGDGAANGGASCPCGNDSTVGAGEGCRNSTLAGGKLGASGRTAVGDGDQLVLTATGLPIATFTFLLQGDQQLAVGTHYDGLACVGGQLVRMGVKPTIQGQVTFPGPGEPPLSLRGGVPSSGGMRAYQLVYRNVVGPCGTFANTTSGVSVIWQP